MEGCERREVLGWGSLHTLLLLAKGKHFTGEGNPCVIPAEAHLERMMRPQSMREARNASPQRIISHFLLAPHFLYEEVFTLNPAPNNIMCVFSQWLRDIIWGGVYHLSLIYFVL